MPYKNPADRNAHSRRYAKTRLPQNLARTLKWNRENPERRLSIYRRFQLKRYGLTEADYQRRFDEQGGKCAICGEPESRTYRGKPTMLVVDHDHETCKVRGLLCHACNSGIGLLKSVLRIRAAISYLEAAA